METPEAFWGCHKNGAHTPVPGECGQAPPPKKTVSITRHAVDSDGYPVIVLDSYTLDELAELIAPTLKYLIDAHRTSIGPGVLASHAASVIVNREEP